MAKIKYIDIKEFRELGLVQEINRRILHPMGLALEVQVDDVNGQETLGDVWDFRDDPEGLRYADGMLDQKAAMKSKNIDLMFESKRERREKYLGYHIQPIEVPDA